MRFGARYLRDKPVQRLYRNRERHRRPVESVILYDNVKCIIPTGIGRGVSVPDLEQGPLPIPRQKMYLYVLQGIFSISYKICRPRRKSGPGCVHLIYALLIF